MRKPFPWGSGGNCDENPTAPQSNFQNRAPARKRGVPMSSDRPPKDPQWEGQKLEQHHYNDRTVIKSGSYLNSFCPHCGESLMRENKIRLDIVTAAGQEGWVDLSPYLNVFERISDTLLPEGEVVRDLRCPHCRHSLKVEGRKCGAGDSSVASILVGISSVQVPYYFCMRSGCRWHSIDPDDEHKIILDDSMEW